MGPKIFEAMNSAALSTIVRGLRCGSAVRKYFLCCHAFDDGVPGGGYVGSQLNWTVISPVLVS